MLLFFIIINECAANKSPLRIFGGDDAKTNEYPYVIRIEIRREGKPTYNIKFAKHDHLCTASALSSKWALTAAHCLVDLDKFYFGVPYDKEKLVVRHGHVTHSPWNSNSFSDVLRTIVHPLYTYSYGEFYNMRMKNDVGILETTPMHIAEYVKLSAVDYLSFYGHEAIVAGYGLTNDTFYGDQTVFGSTQELRKPLQTLELLISKCTKEEHLLPALCLAPKCDHTVTICGGDSGGPLIHKSGLIGVLSLGEFTAYCLNRQKRKRVDIAGIVLPISPYIDWIKSYITR